MNCLLKSLSLFFTSLLLSSFEINIIEINAIETENRAGYL